MNIPVRKSIKLKLFAAMASVLLFNCLFILFFGNFFMQVYFNRVTSMELESYGKKIYSSYKNDRSSIDTVLNELENKNTFIAIYMANSGNTATVYISRPEGRRRLDPGAMGFFLSRSADEINMEGLITGQAVISGEGDKQRPVISLHMKLEENVYLIAETPKAYLQDISQRAVLFTAIVSGFTFFLGGIIIFILSGAVTAPIRKIQDTADKIAGLDFSHRCEERTGDELGLLACSINNMSDRLQNNINQLRSANEALREQLLQKERMERNRREFIANVSHDFKTPLTLIMSYSEELKDQLKKGGPADMQYCDIIAQEGEKMSTLVQQLLRLSQLESPSMTLERSIFAINEIIDGSINKNKIMAGQKKISIRAKTEDSFIVEADFLRIEQAFTNLFDNALKYCNEGGSIWVRAERRLDKCRISVENTGSHIEEEEKENLFQSFYKGDKSRGLIETSYGLGLAIVKAIADMHREACGAENTEEGVLFYFELPCVDLEEEGE